MPFLVRKTDAPEDASDWTIIPTETVVELRKKFIARHVRLLAIGGPDYTADQNVIEIESSFFNALVQSAQLGHYLVAQYIVHPDDKTLTLALCIKQKSARRGVDDTLSSPFSDVSGTSIDDIFYSTHVKYLARRAVAAHFIPAYAKDREGRAHMIVPAMKEAVRKMHHNSNKIYCYFILDDKLGGIDTMSVVFSDKKVSLDGYPGNTLKLEEDADFLSRCDAYDHGTACCPID